MTEVLRFEGGVFAEVTYLILAADGRATLVDPGWATGEALQALESSGHQLVSVLLTHAHIDHIEGLPALRARWDVPVRMHPADEVLYANAHAQASAFGLQLEHLPEALLDLEHGAVVEIPGCTLSVRHVPGHAPGHVMFHCPDEGWALVGDVVFRGSIGRTDLPGGDLRTLMTSIRGEILTLPDATRLLPGHGPETTVGFERVGNPFLVPHYGGELA